MAQVKHIKDCNERIASTVTDQGTELYSAQSPSLSQSEKYIMPPRILIAGFSFGHSES